MGDTLSEFGVCVNQSHVDYRVAAARSHGRDVDRVAAALYTPVLLPTANFVYAGLWQTASMLFQSGSATKAA